MIPEKLLDFKYYYNKLPIYLQQSEGFPEHFRYWIELLQGIDNYADNMIQLLDIFNSNYLSDNPNCSNFLDKLGLLYGVSRNIGGSTPLNDKLMLLLIRLQIVKNYFNGTWEDLLHFYRETAGLPITYRTTDTLKVQILFVKTVASGYTDDELDLIDSLLNDGYFYIQSLGVQYYYLSISFDNVGFWNQSNWDDCEWGV